MLKEFLTTVEAASTLNLHPETVKYFCRIGKLKGEKVSVGWLILRTGVKSFASTYKETRGRPYKRPRVSRDTRGELRHRDGAWQQRSHEACWDCRAGAGCRLEAQRRPRRRGLGLPPPSYGRLPEWRAPICGPASVSPTPQG